MLEVTILGSGGGIGIPNPFCRCANCEAARADGGRSLRGTPAVLINDDLLIDCSRDLYARAGQLGLSLTRLRTLVITHSHHDHFSPWFFWGRGFQAQDTDLPLLTIYAPQDALDKLLAFYHADFGWDKATFERETRTLCRPVHAGMLKIAGRYRLRFFPAAHGLATGVETVLVGVQDARSAYLHCYDSGPLSDQAWALLGRYHFDAVTLDSCIFQQADFNSAEHMNFAQTVTHASRMREMGILKPGGTALATHFVHQAVGAHAVVAAAYEAEGMVAAYDGLVLSLGNADP